MIVQRLLGLVGRSYRKKQLPTVLMQMNMEQQEEIERRAKHPASNTYFNLAITVAIMANCVLMGVEADYGQGETIQDRLVYFVCESISLIVFFVEMLMRQNQLGWDYFIDPWNVFDYVLMVLNAMDVVISLTRKPEANMSANLKLAKIFRVLRLMRVSRHIRGLKMLEMLFQGFLNSLRTLGWMFLLLLMMVYIAALTVASLCADIPNISERWRFADQYVGSVAKTLWTMIQILTLDNWATDIGRPLGEVSPLSLSVAIIMIIITSLGSLKLVISVMVRQMQEIAELGEEATKALLDKTENEILMSMAEEFAEADVDEYGEVTLDEFRRMLNKESLVMKLRLLGIQAAEAESLFSIMDADDSGSVSPEEFVTGLTRLRGVAKGEDLVQLICFAQKQCVRATIFVDRLRELNKKAEQLQLRMDGVGRGMSSELRMRDVQVIRNDDVWEKAAERQTFIGVLDKHRAVDFPSLAPDYTAYATAYAASANRGATR
jgi:voltage-gated sodium channel